MAASQKKFTGVLLVGGVGSRLGKDKALLERDGRPLWQRCCAVLAATCEQVLLAGNRTDLADGSIPHFADAFPGSSLGGIHTGLTHAVSDWITVLPCDLPWPSTELLRYLQAACSDGYNAVVPRTRMGREPLVACYHKNALPEITARLKAGQPKVLDLLDTLEVRYLEEDELPPGWRRSLYNINSRKDLDDAFRPPPAISFIANSGTGKTTLLEKLITELNLRGWSVGALKHDAHKFEIDHEGKDSWRLTRAGAAITSISSPEKTAIIRNHEAKLPLDELLLPFQGKVDIVLTEGFRSSKLPKIEVHRRELNKPLLSRGTDHDPNLIAVASDIQLNVDVPVFDLDDITELATFIENNYLS